MILTRHELRQGLKPLIIWTMSIAAFMMTCIFLYPEMKDEMGGLGEMFSSMGSFSKAFGMDVLSFGTLKGYYAVECGNVLGIGGAMFAALIGISALAKEEGAHTAEFLFAHPLSRFRAVVEKGLSVLIQLIFLNGIVFALSALSVKMINETIVWRDLALLHIAFFLVQVEIAAICLFFSALLRGGGTGFGLGFALVLYFLNLIANISESVEWLKYLTPFSFAEGSEVLTSGKIEPRYLIPGMCLTALGILAAFPVYAKKELR